MAILEDGVSHRVIIGDRERCLECGMNDYVSKPVRVKLLVDAIQRVLVESGRIKVA